MISTERVTVSLPASYVAEIDSYEKNRSRFVTLAIARELRRRRKQALLRSLRNPHPESVAGLLAETGFDEWAKSMPESDEGLVDPNGGQPLRWLDGQGWVTEE